MYYPSKKEFIRLAKKANVIPVYREMLGDLLTPVSAYMKLRDSYSYLLESVEGEEKIARYSFIGIKPSIIFKSKGKNIEIVRKGKTRKFSTSSPLKEIASIMKGFRLAEAKGLPRFSGGMVGYMGYDMVRFFEEVPDDNVDDLKMPDSIFMMADSHIIFDHSRHTIKVVVNAYVQRTEDRGQKTEDRGQKTERIYEKTVKKIDKIIKELNKKESKKSKKRKTKTSNKISSNFTKKGFEGAVRKAKEYIKAGDIIQVVLSQRFHARLDCDPLDVYRELRSLNPSPYMYYLNFGEVKMIGSSPELLVRCEDNIVETRPIAGTRPRGKNEEEDSVLEKELLMDAKERAEHVMLVDLGRNDIGRVCEPGTVKVSEFMFVEKYSHVMHIVSNCKGYLSKKNNAYDVLQAGFPAGTVSGAPKIRAMEIIDELEKTRRGPYAGAVGYFSFSGNLDTCINIRTIVVKGKDAYIQAGAGIVADSVPSREYQETVNKARAMMRAIEIAREGVA
ncbi:MAG: anthranilate synthase component I [Candidatus Omnitrophica bacterium]|nr:anthranilate synthase component I [Candidatus Omnitrophota bacterium]